MDNRHYRILQLISSSGFYGAENVVYELSLELNRERVKNIVGVMTNSHGNHNELVEKSRNSSIKVISFRSEGRINFGSILAIRRYAIENGIDIIHSHGYKANIYGLLASVGSGIKTCATCHNWISRDLMTKLYYLIEMCCLRYTNKVVAVSDSVEKIAIDKGISRKRLERINNGISIREVGSAKAIRSEFGFKADDIVIGIIGRLSEEKAVDIFIEAALRVSNHYDNLKFLIVGDGPMMENLVALRNKYGLKNELVFAGVRKDIGNIYESIDMLLLTSKTEGLPMVLLEAMAYKVPIVASRVGGIPTLLSDSEDSILVDKDDVEGFSNAIAKIIEMEPFKQRMVENAYVKLVSGYTSSSMTEEYRKVYKKIMLGD